MGGTMRCWPWSSLHYYREKRSLCEWSSQRSRKTTRWPRNKWWSKWCLWALSHKITSIGINYSPENLSPSMFMIWNTFLIGGGGECQWEFCDGQQVSKQSVSLNIQCSNRIYHKEVIKQKVWGNCTEIMLDSGWSVSLVRQDLLLHIQDAVKLPVSSQSQLVTALGVTSGCGPHPIKPGKDTGVTDVA